MIGSWTAKKLNETPDLPVKPNIEFDVDIQPQKETNTKPEDIENVKVI